MTELEFTLAEPDCVAFADYHAAHSPSIRRTYRLLRFGFGGFLMAFGAYNALVKGSLASAIIGFLFAVAWITLVPIWLRRNRRRTTIRMFREGQNLSLFGKHVFRIEPDGLTWASPKSEGKQRWSGIEKVGSTSAHTFLYVSGFTALVVPRAGVVRGDYDAFIAEVRSHVDQPAA